jgi:polyisoprenoid-binding protein YceI
LLAAIAMLVVGVVLFPYLFFHVIEGPAPGRLTLPASGPGSGPIAPGPVSGTWAVATGSEVGYRVQEILFGQHHTAVGRTDKVSGGLIISGTVVAAAAFTVDMGSVKSNQVSRDVQFRDYILSTDKYPHATFRLTRPIELGSIPGDGKIVTEEATGDLTMRGVTRQVTFPIRAKRTSSGLAVNAEIPIKFSEWHIPNPSFVITKVANDGILEVLLDLRPAAK